MDRAIHFEKIVNVRDLGGIATQEGLRVKKRKLLRGGRLCSATDDDVRRMREEMRLSCVVDLRTDYETGHAPDPKIEGTDYVHLPVFDENGRHWQQMVSSGSNMVRALLNFARTEDGHLLTRTLYTSTIADTYCQQQYGRFFDCLADPRHDVVYWHCSQGKDRTGVGAALLLSALGVDRDTIVDDFDHSNDFFHTQEAPVAEMLRNEGGQAEDFTVLHTIIGANKEAFVRGLDLIDTQFGGMDRYLVERLGVTPEKRALLKAKYLES